MVKLGSKPQIIKLARDLHITPGDDAARAVVAFCLRTIRRIRREFPCGTLEELLETAAARLDTQFYEIHSNEELHELKKEFLARGELGFARIEQELNPKVFAITFKLLQPRRGFRTHVSVIDCRGSKAARAYFSKWHELAHLFTQTDQGRLKFMRTHAHADAVDPEEALMDQIAGAVGFLPELIRTEIQGDLSFDEIERLRMRLCPTASQQSAFIGVTKAWPQPCMYLEAKIALRKQDERIQRQQRRFSFGVVAEGDLRAVMVVSNDACLAAGLHIYQNMRVPPGSVITTVFNGQQDSATAIENLRLWRSSDGTVLPNLKIRVQAARFWDGVRGLMLPV
jgi:hypothetical protein